MYALVDCRSKHLSLNKILISGYLCAECELHVDLAQVMFQQILQTLVERVVERLQICKVHSLTQDVLIEGSSKETVQKFVVINRLGHDPAHEFKVTQVVGVTVGAGVGLVRDPVPWGSGK